MTGASPRGVTCSLDACVRCRSRVMGSAQPHCRGIRRPPFRAICVADPSVRSRGERGCPGIAFHPPFGGQFVLRVHAPFRVSPTHSPRAFRSVPRGSSARRASQGSFPFSTSGPERSRTSPGFASPGYVPPSGFRTLLTAFPAPAPPGLFHPGSAHGVATLQSFVPPEEPLRLSAPAALLSFPSPARLAAFPNAVTRRTMVRSRRSVRRGFESRDASASGLCSPRESVAIRQWFRPPAARCSPGLQPLQGLHLHAWPDG
jgi:hypothetical protein